MTWASFGSFLSQELKTASRKRAPATDDTRTRSKPSDTKPEGHRSMIVGRRFKRDAAWSGTSPSERRPGDRNHRRWCTKRNRCCRDHPECSTRTTFTPFAISIATHVRGAIGSVSLAIVSLLQKVLEQPQDVVPGDGWLPLRMYYGSEFVNESLINYCLTHGIELTRSRPWRKNDQAWIEQKNGAVVRKPVGLPPICKALPPRRRSHGCTELRPSVRELLPALLHSWRRSIARALRCLKALPSAADPL
jgi:hypothetical protein